MSKPEKKRGLRPPSGAWGAQAETSPAEAATPSKPAKTAGQKSSPQISPKETSVDSETSIFKMSKELLQTQKLPKKFDLGGNEMTTSLFMSTMPRTSININTAAMQVYRNSVLVERKSCENINVGIRIRPFTSKEKEAMQTREAWDMSMEGKLLDKKKGVVYGFG